MARTIIAPATVGGGTSGPTFTAFTFTAADTVNKNRFASSTGREELVIRNANADSPGVSRKVTLYRSTYGVVEYTLAAGEYVSTGLCPTTWRQSSTDAYIWMDGETDIEFAVKAHQAS